MAEVLPEQPASVVEEVDAMPPIPSSHMTPDNVDGGKYFNPLICKFFKFHIHQIFMFFVSLYD